MKRIGVAVIAAGLAMGGCRTTYQFSGMLRYDNLMTQGRAEESTRAAREQLLERAAQHGLEPVSESGSVLTFRMRAPRYVVTLEDGSTEERFDPRIVRVEARLDNRIGEDVYRYFCWVEGREPAVFTDDDRARFGLALLAVREIFETPISTNLLGE
ncbi:MAG: hypothetical protein H6810_06665 [Phycisphaeraceae bacterium]|nr:MAG: hypothetical protein H6810_06665 [Phycisphaeraceae bacterium]